MDWLFRPERGGFVLLRLLSELLVLAGVLMIVIGVFLVIANLVSPAPFSPSSRSAGTLLGQVVMLFSYALTVIVSGHLLRGVALVLTKQLARRA
jgi:hypothetical protein